jgi:outer membrane immunogenic protein
MHIRNFGPVLAGCLAALASTGAQANSQDWFGPYVGVNLGYSFGASQSRTTTVAPVGGYFATSSIPAIAAVGNQHLSPQGGIAGVQTGYNFAIDSNWVMGIEADFDANSISDKTSGSAAYPCCGPKAFTVGSKIDSSWLFTLRPVIGYSWSSWMLYATGGLALHDQKASFVFADNFAAAAAAGGFSTTKGTWTAGGGVQGKIDANWSWRVEYLYIDYGHMGGTSANLTAGSPVVAYPQNPFTQLASFSGNMVRAGINYRF